MRNQTKVHDDKFLELSKLIANEKFHDLDTFVNIMMAKGFQMSLSDKIMLMERSKDQNDSLLQNYIEKQANADEFNLGKNYKSKIDELLAKRSSKVSKIQELSDEYRKIYHKIELYS